MDVKWALERIEASQLNFGIFTTHVSTVDITQYITGIESLAPEANQVEVALKYLVSQGEIIEWAPGLYRSRIAETVRCLRLLRRRLWSWQDRNHPGSLAHSPLLIEDIRVAFRQRMRPKRDAVLMDDATPNEVPPVIKQTFNDAIGFQSLAQFQAEAIERIFSCAELGNPDNNSFIVSGDTGAGKTEAFIFPILLDILSETAERRQQPGVRAVLVYPRIRLARNQLSRLLRYLSLLQEAEAPGFPAWQCCNGNAHDGRTYAHAEHDRHAARCNGHGNLDDEGHDQEERRGID